FAPGVFIPGFGPPMPYDVPNPAGAVGGNLNFDANKYLKGGACAGGACPVRLPDPLDSGWKDTIKTFPGEITRLAVRWTPQNLSVNQGRAGLNTFPFDPTSGPGYVEHCHILDHEDNEFMRPLLIAKEDPRASPRPSPVPVRREGRDGGNPPERPACPTRPRHQEP